MKKTRLTEEGRKKNKVPRETGAPLNVKRKGRKEAT